MTKEQLIKIAAQKVYDKCYKQGQYALAQSCKDCVLALLKE